MEGTQLASTIVLLILSAMSIICLLIYAVKHYYFQRKRSNELSITQMINRVEKQDWAFFITKDNFNSIMCYDNDKLYFNNNHFIQANQSINNKYKHAYFEIEVLNFKQDQQLLFGLATNMNESKFRDNSVLFNATTQKIELYGKPIEWTCLPTIDEGDIIGCLYYAYPKNEVIFTLNGQQTIALRFGHKKIDIYPTIYASQNCFIGYNFGRLPFYYQCANFNRFGLVASTTEVNIPPTYSLV